MIDMHSKFDHMYKNGIFYTLFCINNDVISDINACYHGAALGKREMILGEERKKIL